VTRYYVQAWARRNAPELATGGKDLAHPALSLGTGAESLMIALFTIFVLAVFALAVLLLLEGSKLRTALLSVMSPAREALQSRDDRSQPVGQRLQAGAISRRR
jgi:hypothetical protein